MVKKIHAIILRKNRSVETKKVHPDNTYFKSKGNLYTIPKEAVNLAIQKGKVNNPIPELVFVEGNPVPINVNLDITATGFLEKLVIENALKSSGKPKGFALEAIMAYIKEPKKMFMLLIVAIIAISFIIGVLNP